MVSSKEKNTLNIWPLTIGMEWNGMEWNGMAWNGAMVRQVITLHLLPSSCFTQSHSHMDSGRDSL